MGGGFTKGRASFILGMRDLVTNTANFYLDSGQEKDPVVAANRAFEDVVGGNYNLNNKINDGVVRFDKSITEETATNVTEILSVSLLNNVDYLKTVVVPPPAPFGLDEAGIQQHNENYYEDSKIQNPDAVLKANYISSFLFGRNLWYHESKWVDKLSPFTKGLDPIPNAITPIALPLKF